MKFAAQNHHHSAHDEKSKPLLFKEEEEHVLRLLQSLPLDAKVEIICFIPTTSRVISPYGRNDLTGAKLWMEHIDPWWFSYMKHRLIGPSVKTVLEHIIGERLSKSEGLDASDLVLARVSKVRFHPIWKLLEINQERCMKRQVELSLSNSSYGILLNDKKELFQCHGDFGSLGTGISLSDTTLTLHHVTPSSSTTETTDSVEDSLMTEMMQRDLRDLENELVENALHDPQLNTASPFLVGQARYGCSDSMHLIQSCKNLVLNAFSEWPTVTSTRILDAIPQITNQCLKNLTISISSDYDYQICKTLLNSLHNVENVTFILYSLDFFHNFVKWTYEGIEYPSVKSVKFICLSSDTNYGLPDIMIALTSVFPNISKLEIEGFAINDFRNSIQNSTTQDHQIEIIYKSMSVDLLKNICTIHNIYPFLGSPDCYTSTILHHDLPFTEKKKIIEYIVQNFDMKYHHWINNSYHYQTTQALPLFQYTIYLMNKYGQHFGTKAEMDFLTILKVRFPKEIIDMLEDKLKKNEVVLTLDDFLQTLIRLNDSETKLQVFSRFKNYLPGEDANKIFKSFVLHKHNDLRVNLFNYLLYAQSPRPVLDYILDFMTPEDLLETAVVHSEMPLPGKHVINSIMTAILSDSVDVSDQLILKMIEKQPLLVHTEMNELGITPLHAVCAITSRWGLISHLVYNYDANVCATDKDGRTPYDYAIYACPFQDVIPACLRISGQRGTNEFK
nr:unnamed protein product [Naegleria fowleri]